MSEINRRGWFVLSIHSSIYSWLSGAAKVCVMERGDAKRVVPERESSCVVGAFGMQVLVLDFLECAKRDGFRAAIQLGTM
jgi:hypothetical protein